MAKRIAINGFGRIGRCALRAAAESNDLEVVAVNDIAKPEINAYLLKYDSVHGRFPGSVELKDNHLLVNGKTVRICAETDPSKLPWKELGVDVILECTGRFTSREKASAHLQAGARKVIISAPAKDKDVPTFVVGINDENYNLAEHHVVSNASCTTNCLAPVAKVLLEKFNILKGFMTTVHSYTNDQRILDLQHEDPRRARAAAQNMIPTTTGAAKAVGLVLPALKGKMDGIAVRVPTANVSLVDLVAEVEKTVTIEEVNAAFKEASQGALKGILDFYEEPLVSSDFNHHPVPSNVDGLSTNVMGGKLVKVLSWYDNEWGFTHQMLKLARRV
ncbi:MAG: Glyceraldehyde-3-phosphate dehydrogenase [Myxococcota bacterium]|nr:Glyceraldehyde-3-phosphate dehydrogenase [Myxococcota bacterium]